MGMLRELERVRHDGREHLVAEQRRVGSHEVQVREYRKSDGSNDGRCYEDGVHGRGVGGHEGAREGRKGVEGDVDLEGRGGVAGGKGGEDEAGGYCGGV